LKLANVAPRFIKAYSAGEIRLDLEALAITDDQQTQEKVWDSLCHDWERSPRKLRSLLTEKQVSASDRRRASTALTPRRSEILHIGIFLDKPDPRAHEMGVKSFNVRFEKKSKNHRDSGQRTPLGRALATLSIPSEAKQGESGSF